MTTEIDLLKQIVAHNLPNYEYFVKYRYRVVKVHPEDNYRVDLQIVKKKSGLPDLLPMIMNPGVAGCVAKLAEGCIVLVEFIEGDPTMPRITSYSDYQDAGFLPDNLFIDSNDLLKLGKISDIIEFGDVDQQKIARYPAIKSWADLVIAYLGAVHSVLTTAGFPPSLPVPSQLTSAASSSKVTSQ